MPTVRVDSDVYKWLQSLATPFEDNPNSVLRRVAGIEDETRTQPQDELDSGREITNHRRPTGRLTGKALNTRWNVNAQHALYHRDGTFYENLTRFPGALFDPDGYMIFKTEGDYLNSSYLKIGQKVNVPGGIASIPGYIRRPVA